MNNLEIKRSSFKHNFLKQIILRLDFQGVLPDEIENILKNVKIYLKQKEFNRYEKKIKNATSITSMDAENLILKDDIKNSDNIIHSFVNLNKGCTIDLSMNCLCLVINTSKYIPFDEYATIFIDIANMYISTIDLFTVERFGLRKINFCFLSDVKHINKYFSSEYFDPFCLSGHSNILVSEKKDTIAIDEYKVNLLRYIEKGLLSNRPIYKVTLDLDAYIDQSVLIEEPIFSKGNMYKLNDLIFEAYVGALTDKFKIMLSDDEATWSDEIEGVEANE